MKPRIDQVLPNFDCYDAIGIDNQSIRDLLQGYGFESDIFSEKGVVRGKTRHLSEYFQYSQKGNIVIHHFSIGSLVPYFLLGVASRKITRYHNITPAKFFPLSPHQQLPNQMPGGSTTVSIR